MPTLTFNFNFNGIQCKVKDSLSVLLTIAFIVAKLTNLISWSWWFVFAPTLAVIVFAIVATIAMWAWNKIIRRFF